MAHGTQGPKYSWDQGGDGTQNPKAVGTISVALHASASPSSQKKFNSFSAFLPIRWVGDGHLETCSVCVNRSATCREQVLYVPCHNFQKRDYPELRAVMKEGEGMIQVKSFGSVSGQASLEGTHYISPLLSVRHILALTNCLLCARHYLGGRVQPWTRQRPFPRGLGCQLSFLYFLLATGQTLCLSICQLLFHFSFTLVSFLIGIYWTPPICWHCACVRRGVVSIYSHFVWWHFQNTLTHNSSHQSEFEALVIMCVATYWIAFSLGNTFATNLCYFENRNVCLQSRGGSGWGHWGRRKLCES